MGISCQHGSPFAVGARGCRRDGSRDFGGIVTPMLQAFEETLTTRSQPIVGGEVSFAATVASF
jgi:hypothetical protein